MTESGLFAGWSAEPDGRSRSETAHKQKDQERSMGNRPEQDEEQDLDVASSGEPDASNASAQEDAAYEQVVVQDPEVRAQIRAMRSAATERTSWKDAYQEHVASQEPEQFDARAYLGRPLVQFGVFGVVGLVGFMVWGATEPSRQVPPFRPMPPPFPRVAIEDVPPLSEEDAQRLLDRVHWRSERDAAARRDVRVEGQTFGVPTSSSTQARRRIVLKPGMVIDPERGVVYELPAPQPVVPSATNEARSLSDEGAKAAGSAARKHAVLSATALYEPGGFVSVPWAALTQERRDAALPVGVRIPVVLEIGFHAGAGADVLARVARDVRIRGRVPVQSGDLLRGRGRTDGRRVYIDFEQAIVAGRAHRLRGFAVQGELPGIALAYQGPKPSDDVANGAASGALDAMGELASVLVGSSVVGRVLEGAARGAVSPLQARLASRPEARVVLPAGTQFEVVVLNASGRP